jgi:diguanylate cyclase (GGDEF)-like protein
MEKWIVDQSRALEKYSRPFWLLIGLSAVILLGAIDYLSGYEFSFSLFYLIPIIAVTWFAGNAAGMFISAASVFTWLTADLAGGYYYSNPLLYCWNSIMRFAFFALVSYLLVILKKTLASVQELARTDYLTGAANTRRFYDLAQMEIQRFRRYKRPLSVAYLDLDNFKTVNDTLGHNTGDQVLQMASSALQREVRSTDTVARLGGDEFALLLPETGAGEARVILNRVRQELTSTMHKNGWPVTFSIGVVTYNSIPGSVDDMVKEADSLMLSVKMRSKDGVRFLVHT